MSRDDPYGKRGPRKTPKSRPALPSAAVDGEPTMVMCPLCEGERMVSPEVAAAFEGKCREENIQYFRNRLAELLADPLVQNKFVVIHEEAVRASFDTFQAALEHAIANYPQNEFVIQQVVADDARISYIRASA